MRLTIRHSYDFGADRELVGDDLVRPRSWDALRTQTSGPFAIAGSRAELDATADAHPEVRARAEVIDHWLQEQGAATLASYGAGGALPEVWLQRLRPERRLMVTDYAPETVARLRELVPELDPQLHDFLSDPPLDADAHLFHRIDTELTDAEFRLVLGRFSTETILVVATEVADLPRMAAEFFGRLRRRGLTRAGWLRNRASFEALFASTHVAQAVRFHDLDGWVLAPRSAQRRPT